MIFAKVGLEGVRRRLESEMRRLDSEIHEAEREVDVEGFAGELSMAGLFWWGVAAYRSTIKPL